MSKVTRSTGTQFRFIYLSQIMTEASTTKPMKVSAALKWLYLAIRNAGAHRA